MPAAPSQGMPPAVDPVVDDAILLVDRTDETDPARYGRDAFVDALERGGVDVTVTNHWTAGDHPAPIVIGTATSRVVSRLLADDPALDCEESIIYRWCDIDAGTALVVAGGDGRGVMYGLLELAERVIADGATALTTVEPAVETPDNAIRGVDRFVETPVEDDWLTDPAFWTYYLDRLARDRFNRFVLVTGYDTSFMSPPYPFLVDVPGFSDVHVGGNVDRETYRETIRSIGRACHRRGIEFLVGIWQQQPWTDYQGLEVDGLPEDEALDEYCAAGLETLLTVCPEIDGVQLRVNYESGVSGEGTATAERFWHGIIDAVAAAGHERGDEPVLDLRAKGLTDGMIDHALETGLDVAVPTKFWCESTGLPYHNTVMRSGELANLDDPNRSRRYSYADLLGRPRAYDMLYRLWTIGTNRVFVWGDPDYARRFSAAAGFVDGRGFEITAPLSLKGGYHGLREAGWPLLADESDRWYDWEDERYWAWYRLFGRLGYDRTTDPDCWLRCFDAAYGEAGTPLARAYRAASKVLPLHTAAHLTSHPALHNWAELDTGGALFGSHNANKMFGETTYASAEPSDPGLFYGIDEYVREPGAGKYTPPQVAGWFAALAAETRAALEAAGAPTDGDARFRTTWTDLAMLADLADFHAQKTHAALALARYETHEAVEALPTAHAHALAMRTAWSTLSERGAQFHDDLVFGRGPQAGDGGTWADRLAEIDADLDALAELLGEHELSPGEVVPTVDPEPLPPSAGATLVTPTQVTAGEPIRVQLRTEPLGEVDAVRLHYRRANQLDGAFETVDMERDDRGYTATVPATVVTDRFDVLVYCSIVGPADRVTIAPGLWHPDDPSPYRVIGTAG